MSFSYQERFAAIEILVGMVVTAIEPGDDEIIFRLEDGRSFKMHHYQNCCEDVYLEDVVGDWSDLIGSPILRAEERRDNDNPKSETYGDRTYVHESSTWTFYHLATIKGSVDLRWYGTSNGYYSESVDFERIV